MKLLPFIAVAALILIGGRFAAHAEPARSIAEAVEKRQLTIEAHGQGRDQLTLTLHNQSPEPVTISIPAGLIFTSAKTENRVIGLRAATVEMPAQGTVDVALPVVALSSKNTARPQSFTITTDTEPRLTALLQALASQPDAPRSTVQLATLGLLEDLTFAQWRQFLGTAAELPPTPAEVTQAIDALGLLRTVAPQQSFALIRDAELKLRALRNPWCRAKAMVVYGLDFGDGAVPPDLRQLLHTQPGDNCPICRQRTLLQGPADAP